MKLSYSHIKNFKQCPKKYEYISVKKKSPGYSTDAHFGTIVHNVLADYFMVYLNNQQSMFPEEWNIHTLRNIFEQKTKHLSHDWLETAWNQLHTYATTVIQDNDTPLFIEHPFHWEFSGHTLSGRIDRIDTLGGNKVRIVEYKTQPCTATKHALQVAIYAHWMEQFTEYSVEEIEVHDLAQATRWKHDLSHISLDDLRNTFQNISYDIEHNIFPATPSSHCQYCPFQIPCQEGQKFLQKT